MSASDIDAIRRRDRAEAERLIDVSRETWDRFERHIALLDRWQAKTNLVSPSTLTEIWTRHVVDGAQLAALAPEDCKVWVDLGSGGGFPGLVVAAMRARRTTVHLVESNNKKAAFLREAARAMEIDAVVHPDRAEDVLGVKVPRADVVSARALAPLADLVRLAEPLLKTGAVGLFPKGREAERELTTTGDCWRLRATLLASLTDPEGRIVRIDGAAGRSV